MTKQPRGIRNNNPGNVRWGSPWIGLVPLAQRTDKDFCQFVKPAYGIRALTMTLLSYYDHHGLHTVRGIVSRWAPPVENDTDAYSAAVASAMGVGPDDDVNVHMYSVMLPLVKAIIRHENGQQPYRDETLDQALQMVGIVKPSASVLSTPGGVAQLASVASGGAAVVTVAADAVSDAMLVVADGVGQTAPTVTAIAGLAASASHLPNWLQGFVAVLMAGSIFAGVVALHKRHQSAKEVAP